MTRDAETASIPFWTALAGVLRRCYAFVWPCRTALATPRRIEPRNLSWTGESVRFCGFLARRDGE